MFDQAVRLLRQQWEIMREMPDGNKERIARAQLLAEEMFVILTAPVPLTHNAPVKIRNDQNEESTEPPLELFPPPGIPGIQINNSDGVTTTVGPDGVTNTDADGNQTQPGGGGGGLVGKIVSGSGTTYTVNLFEDGLSSAATDQVSATAPYLDDEEDIPNDSVVGVVQAGSVYHIQIGYWL